VIADSVILHWYRILLLNNVDERKNKSRVGLEKTKTALQKIKQKIGV
jgi:hypothetical protein